MEYFNLEAEQFYQMKGGKFLLFLLFSSPALASVPVITPPANFGKGENLRTAASEIDQSETPYSNNMINTITGAVEKRNGSRFFAAQAHSTNSITSLYRAYGSTSNADSNKVLIVTTRDRILTSTGGINPLWLTISSGHPHNSRWEFVTAQNRVILAEESLTSPMKRYDIMTASFTNHTQQYNSSETANIRAKHILYAGDQLLAANVVLVSSPDALTAYTTYYNSRMYYTPILFPSSFTYQRHLVFDQNDGEEITGLSDYKGIYVWKPSRVFKLTYTDLSPGGDMSVQTIINGFGLFAPRSLAFTGDFFIFADKGGIRLWDGSVKTRLQVEQESKPISGAIQPVIDRCIKANTWKNAVGIYYPARSWYLLSIEDPTANPKGANNIVWALDLNTLSWFRFTNWNAACWTVQDGFGDKGELLYGSSSDGYVYFADDKISANDARREFSINSLDNVADWAGGKIENDIVKEGTASIRMTAQTAQMFSSITYMAVINAGEWPDKKRVNKNDKLSFKVYVTSAQNLLNLRLDLEINDIRDGFDAHFTSVTISSNALINSNTSWMTIEVAFSSFPIINEWVNLSSEAFTFANTLTFFGVRFQATGTAGFNMVFDDLRVVDDTERSLEAERWSKQFNFGAASKKEFKEVLLNADLSSDSQLFIDVYKDFGNFVDRRTITKNFEKEIFIGTYLGAPNITKLDSVTFDKKIATEAVTAAAFSIESLAVDRKFIYGGDQSRSRIVKIDKSSFSAFISTYGEFGTGTTNFAFIGQIGMDEDFLYIADVTNNRVKVHRKSDLSFVRSFGQLGLNTTSYHLPQGVAVDGAGGNLYVANDGNYNILKLNKETGEFKLSADLDEDTYGESSLAIDDQNLFVAYRAFSPNSVFSLDLILEKRDKSSMAVLDKIVVLPVGSVALSTYAYEGDISLSGNYIYMVFTNNAFGEGIWYLQKRLKSDFSIVKEYSSASRIGTVAANELSFYPSRKTIEEPLGTDGKYIQLKYSEGDALDNQLKFFNQAFKLIPEEIR